MWWLKSGSGQGHVNTKKLLTQFAFEDTRIIAKIISIGFKDFQEIEIWVEFQNSGQFSFIKIARIF